MAREYGWLLIRRGLASRDRVLLDLGLDLAVPPLASVAMATLAGAAVSFAAAWLTGAMLVAAWTWSIAAAALACYVVRGWWISGTRVRGLSGLMHAPSYVVWKLGLALSRRVNGPQAWVRTAREQTESVAPPPGSGPAPAASP